MKKIILIIIVWCLSGEVALGQKYIWHNYLAGHEVFCLAEEGNTIWAGTIDGVFQLDKLTGNAHFHKIGYMGIGIASISIDPSGIKWIGSLHGLHKIDDTGISKAQYPSHFVFSVQHDSEGRLWVAFMGGIALFDGESWLKYNPGNSAIPDYWVTDLIIDSLDNKWMTCTSEWGYYPRGLVKFDGINWMVYDTVNSILPSNDITLFSVDRKNRIWLTTLNHELLNFDGVNWNNVSLFGSIPDDMYIYSITCDKNNSMWFASSQGLMRYDGLRLQTFDTINSVLPDNQVYCVLAGDDGTLWVGTQSGLTSLSEDNITSLGEERIDGLSNIESFPNPVTDILNIRIPHNSTLIGSHADIIDMRGKILKHILLTNFSTQVYIGNLPAGTYIIRFHKRKKSACVKFRKR